MGDAGSDAFQQLVSGSIISPDEGMLEGQFVCRTVALEDETPQAEQGRAVVATVIHLALKGR